MNYLSDDYLQPLELSFIVHSFINSCHIFPGLVSVHVHFALWHHCFLTYFVY